jgi:chromosome segregation ATPase
VDMQTGVPTLSERLDGGMSALGIRTDELIARCDALDIRVDSVMGELGEANARSSALEAALLDAKTRANDLEAALVKAETRANDLAAALVEGETRANEAETRVNELQLTLAESERSNEELATSNAILRAQVWDQRRIISENHSGKFTEVQQENASLLMKLESARNALRKTGSFGGEERAQLIKALGKLRHEKAVLEEQCELVRLENSRLAVIVHDYVVKEEQQAAISG